MHLESIKPSQAHVSQSLHYSKLKNRTSFELITLNFIQSLLLRHLPLPYSNQLALCTSQNSRKWRAYFTPSCESTSEILA